MVRTQHLPPPAKTARSLRKRGPAGRFLLVPPCVIVCRHRAWRSNRYGHMADSVRAEGAVRGTASCAVHASSRRLSGSGAEQAAGALVGLMVSLLKKQGVPEPAHESCATAKIGRKHRGGPRTGGSGAELPVNTHTLAGQRAGSPGGRDIQPRDRNQRRRTPDPPKTHPQRLDQRICTRRLAQ